MNRTFLFTDIFVRSAAGRVVVAEIPVLTQVQAVFIPASVVWLDAPPLHRALYYSASDAQRRVVTQPPPLTFHSLIAPSKPEHISCYIDIQICIVEEISLFITLY